MNIIEWADIINIHPGSVVSVVGCGGKTTAIRCLASALSDKHRVGIGTTTKIRFPRAGSYDELFIRGQHECTDIRLSPGTFYFADEVTSDHKLHEFGAYMLAQAKGNTDIILIEADGSKEKPLKGWANFEPVIPEDTTMTIGVITLHEIGKKATEENVHRLPLFREQVGIKDDDVITAEHICHMINHPRGMFKGSACRRILLINQIDSPEEMQLACDFAAKHDFNVDDIYIGSMKYEHVIHFED